MRQGNGRRRTGLLLPIYRHTVKLMTRRRDSYLGGSTVHIPARDSRSADEGPPQALARAREQAAQERLASATVTEEGAALFLAFFKEFYAAYKEVDASGERAGSSLARFDALNWREKLTQIVELERRCGNNRKAKSAQAVMGRLAKAEKDLRFFERWPEEARYKDALYWFMVLFPL
jgi:hypothetical protein